MKVIGEPRLIKMIVVTLLSMNLAREAFAKLKQKNCSRSVNELQQTENMKFYLKGNCTKENEYGFKQGKPCILLKLNRIIGWVPEEIDAKYPPEGIPWNIMDEIKKNKEDGNDDLVS